MKKFLAILLVAMLLLSVTACGNKQGALISGIQNNKKDIVATFQTENGSFAYEYVESDTIRIMGYDGKVESHDLVISEKMNDLTVVAIADGAFYGLSNIKSVTLPNTVTTIGANAFAGCRGLVSVSIPASITSLGVNAFYNCEKLTTVTFTNTEAAALTAIPKSAFNGCVALNSINLPATVTVVDSAAFFNCASLTDVILPAALERVGMQAFQNCAKLSTVTFGDQIKVCEPHAFDGCDALTNVVCPVLTGWSVFYEDAAEAMAITFDSAEAAIQMLTETYYNYTFVRNAD